MTNTRKLRRFYLASQAAQMGPSMRDHGRWAVQSVKRMGSIQDYGILESAYHDHGKG